MRDLSRATQPILGFRRAHANGDPVALTTTGTTAASRKVVRSTDSWLSSFAAYSELSGIGSDSRVWVPGPASASMNLFAVIHADAVGAFVTEGPTADDATHAVLTPALLSRTLASGLPPGLTVIVAGDALSAGLARTAAEAGVTVHHYYGAAELSFVAWGSHSGDLTAFPGVDLDVRDGEIWVRSPYLCQGYLGPPGPLRRAADRWATVGDRGALRAGVLAVHGRPGAVTTGGATVLVAEVEAVLRTDASGDVVVVGVPHPDLGSVLVAILTDPADHQRLVRRARSELPAPARPRRWFSVDSPPVGAAGKVDRDALARLARRDGRTGAGSVVLRPLTGS